MTLKIEIVIEMDNETRILNILDVYFSLYLS